MYMASKKKILLILLAMLAVLTLWILWANTALELNEYTITSERLPKGFDGFRIAHVSDLHNAEFGADNVRLLDLLRSAEPDLIAITGDLIDSRNTDVEIALRFAQEAMQIAPCFYVPGNHESRVSVYPELKAGLSALGVVVLEDARFRLELGGEEITLLGLRDPTFDPAVLYSDDKTVTAAKLQGLTAGLDGYTVLLSHRPELFGVYVENGADLVLTGHAHGGQVRLPFLGGLIAPHQGFFPEYDAGLYTAGNTNMLVSRGVGNSIAPLRINNRPEILLVIFQCPAQ